MITIRNDEFELIEFIIYYLSEEIIDDTQLTILLNDKIHFKFYLLNNRFYLENKFNDIKNEEDLFREIANLILENLNSKIELRIQNLDVKDVNIKTNYFEKDKLIQIFSSKLDDIREIYLKLNKLDCKFQSTCEKELENDLCSILKEKLTFEEIISKIKISGYELLYKLFDLYNSNRIKLFRCILNRKNINEILKVIDEKYKTPYLKNLILKYSYEDLSFNSFLELV